MAPTEDADDRLNSTWDGDNFRSSPPLSPRETEQSIKSTCKDPLELSLSLQDLDNTCEIYFCGWDSGLVSTTSARHLAVPEASADFRVSIECFQRLKLVLYGLTFCFIKASHLTSKGD
ncbi:hypothetical protein ElyMa_006243000 [Elysia marginata]|uniref:Uncharacterized protein n=1 Tax=Elysia marginata TaxID=1093978 RepID=A0AAV4H868_9GAST|nr:hypothetical protein ElyMa_006243000 [Elysia marginata]